ncbi:hypothetical protein J6Y73_04515 [bacterium]|nr:hypothetical protein [bacterium]
MEELDQIILINELYDYYKELLTDKQREYFEAFYFLNMSLKEIAENYNVSRNAVYSQLTFTKEVLIKYEQRLKLREKNIKLSEMIERLKELKLDDVDNIIKKYEEV